MAQATFWTALAFTMYVYAGYPLLLMVWRRFAARRVNKRYIEPPVSLVVVMHNERHSVVARMRNCFALDYPADKLQIIVSLDAPTDGTDVLLGEYAAKGVKVLQSVNRIGKAAAVNRGVNAATGEIVLFADARQSFDRNVVRELVANFADETVGVVSGQLMIMDETGRESADTVGLYWRYEKALRSMESAIHSVPGGTGAIYAIRRELFVPLPAHAVLDDVFIPMRIVCDGKRSVFEPAARAYDRVSQTVDLEYARKKRTLMGNYELIAQMPELLIPWRNPIAFQFASHKAGRLLVPWCLLALLLSNLFLRHGFYLGTLIGQFSTYALACFGARMANRKSVTPVRHIAGLGLVFNTIRRLAVTCYTFVVMNVAVLAGLYHFLRGHEGFWNVPQCCDPHTGKEAA